MIENAYCRSYQYATQEDRSAPRIKVLVPATLRAVGGKRLQTVVRDISLSGFSAVAITQLVPGTSCWLTIPGHEPRRAQVIWWEHGRTGCAFEQLLDASTLSAIITTAA